ncbi:MAG: hypothetical protein MMC33_008365 [Icmadophila ericetorum]|nr:hypothetical protein [Icmadophila ericetorum]
MAEPSLDGDEGEYTNTYVKDTFSAGRDCAAPRRVNWRRFSRMSSSSIRIDTVTASRLEETQQDRFTDPTKPWNTTRPSEIRRLQLVYIVSSLNHDPSLPTLRLATAENLQSTKLFPREKPRTPRYLGKMPPFPPAIPQLFIIQIYHIWRQLYIPVLGAGNSDDEDAVNDFLLICTIRAVTGNWLMPPGTPKSWADRNIGLVHQALLDAPSYTRERAGAVGGATAAA